jgi:predicted DNA-binding transcriptional regulator AlpA
VSTALSAYSPLQIFSKKEACQLLGFSVRTFDRLKETERPPQIRLSVGRVGYRAADLLAWQEARLVEPSARQLMDEQGGRAA